MQLAIWVSQDLSPGSKLPDSIWCPSVNVPGEWTEPHLPELLIEAEASVTVTISHRFPFWEGDYAYKFGEKERGPRRGMPSEKGCRVSVPETFRGSGAGTLFFSGHVRPGWARGESRPHTIGCQLSCFAPSSSSRAQGTSRLGPALPRTTHPPPHLHFSLCAVACCKSPPMPACVLMKVGCLHLWRCFTPSVVRRYLQRSFQEGVVLWGWGWGQGGGAQCASLLIPFRGCTPVPPRLLEVDVPETM